MPSHIHGNPVAINNGGDASHYMSIFATNSDFWSRNDSNNATASTGGNQAHNNLQPYSTVNYIIKYSNSIGLVGNVVNEKSNSTKDSYSCNYINNLVDYSTNETRVGTWKDGKPLYRKVIELNNLNANPYDIDISSLNAE